MLAAGGEVSLIFIGFDVIFVGLILLRNEEDGFPLSISQLSLPSLICGLVEASVLHCKRTFLVDLSFMWFMRSWKTFERRRAYVVGWKRLFAQRSMDHRGTPQAPGLVATLVSDTDLEALGALRGRNYGDRNSSGDSGGDIDPLPPSVTHGVAYLIPADVATSVLSDLDFREKGGYSHAVADVHFEESSGPGTDVATADTAAAAGAGLQLPRPVITARALFYRGEVGNPNFDAASVTDRRRAARIIARAVGPSGPNVEYLVNLVRFLTAADAGGVAGDEDVIELLAMVEQERAATAAIASVEMETLEASPGKASAAATPAAAMVVAAAAATTLAAAVGTLTAAEAGGQLSAAGMERQVGKSSAS
ncbi:unnamed protein product [Phaeothamnion confervicola]